MTTNFILQCNAIVFFEGYICASCCIFIYFTKIVQTFTTFGCGVYFVTASSALISYTFDNVRNCPMHQYEAGIIQKEIKFKSTT